MKYVVCSVYDLSVGAFTTPFFSRSRGEAIRSFSDAVRDSNLQFGRHAKDFTLVLLSSWDDSDGSFEHAEKAGSIITALEVQALHANGK